MSDKPVAVVTGGARGIGAATAKRLAEDGMAIAVLDLDEPSCEETVRAIGQAGGTALGIGADVVLEASITEAFERIAAELGPPTVLINNAGFLRDNLMYKMSVADWDEVMGVHLRGSFLAARAAQAYMVEAGYGRIVNLSSTSALGNRGQSNYSAAKAGVQGLTKTLSIELGRYGVTVNAVAPGFIATDMTATTAERMGMTFQDLEKLVVAQIPVGRAGRPADVAHAVSFLAGEQAGFVSGQVLYVAGGPTC